MLASPATASAEIAATASGRKSPSSMLSEASATNSPLPVIAERKSGPRPSSPGVETLTAMASRIGTDASTAMPARLRRRPKMSRSSEPRNRNDARRCGRTTDAPPMADSTTDIEALPRERDEQVLEAGCLDGEAAHRLGDDVLRPDGADERPGVTVVDGDLGQSQPAQHAGGVLGPVGVDPGPRLGVRPHLPDRALGHQPADVHHPDVAAHLLD